MTKVNFSRFYNRIWIRNRKCVSYLGKICILGTIVLIIYQYVFSRSTNVKQDENSLFKEVIKKNQIRYHDPRLVDYLRTNYLNSPPFEIRTRRNSSEQSYSQLEQDKYVDTLLNQTQNGFFIEAGAYDGERMSNTLFFEEQRNWTGLLIEANPTLFRELQSRKRNAYISESCLSTSLYAVEVNFTFADYLSGRLVPNDRSLITGTGSVQCFPLMTYLLALNIDHINYFSLDIEGGELNILKQIDFNRIRIDVFTIEYAIKYHNSPESLENLKKINDLLVGSGFYRQVTTIHSLDVVFMRK